VTEVSDYRRPARVGIAINTVIALGVGSLPLFDGDPPSLDADWLRGLGLLGILLIPPALATVGLRRPGALLPAGIAAIPMCLMSFSFILFPLLIPGTLYLVAYGRAKVTYKPRFPAPAVAVLTIVLIGGAFFSLFLHDDPYCYEIVQRKDGTTFERSTSSSVGQGVDQGTASIGYFSSGSGGRQVIESGCSSDSVTGIEAGTSLALVVAAGSSAAFLSGPREKRYV
jgi:hypothetical protein